MPDSSDRALIHRTLQGQTDQFGVLVERYQQSVFNTCYRMLGERGWAEDLAQETFIRAFRRLEAFDPERPFGPWIRKIAANLCLNELRRGGPHFLPLEDEWAAGTDLEGAQERAELHEEVRAALCELPPPYRAVIELRHFQGLTYQEIAETLNLPLNTAKSHLFRARRMLAEKLKAHHEPA